MSLDLPLIPEAYDSWFSNLRPDPLVEAQQFEAWIGELAISEAELARRTGRPRAYIQQRRLLLRAAPEVLQAYLDKRITFTHLREICIGAPENQEAQRITMAMVIRRTAGRRTLDATAIRMFARGATHRA